MGLYRGAWRTRISGAGCSTTPGRPPPEEGRMVAVEKTPDTVYLVLLSTAEGAE
jgi:hypothetical protein